MSDKLPPNTDTTSTGKIEISKTPEAPAPSRHEQIAHLAEKIRLLLQPADSSTGDDSLEKLKTEKLHLLILTPEEERTIRESGGERRELKERAENGAEIVVHGLSHTHDVDKMKEVVEMYKLEKPDIVLIEGGLSLEEVYPGEPLNEILKKDPEQVLAEKGEEFYIALLAAQDGKEVRSWDTRTIEQVRAVLDMKDGVSDEKKWTPQEVTDWIVTYAARRLYENYDEEKDGDKKMDFSADILRGRASIPFPPDALKELASRGIELTEENIDTALQRHVGLSLKELVKRAGKQETRQEDRAKLIYITEPELVEQRRVTSDILRDMNIMRDKFAIDKFRELQTRQPDKKVFVIGGASHLTVWRPAIEELYK